MYITRELLLFDDGLYDTVHLTGSYVIEDFNPEWVSIDVWIDPLGVSYEPIYVEGTIWHECVPEPAILSLLALGSLAVLRRRR